MTEITRDHDGPSLSDTPPMEGTHVTDTSSTSTTREAINLLSNAMAKLSSEMLQLRKDHQTLQPSIHIVPWDHPESQYHQNVQSYGGIPPPPMT